MLDSLSFIILYSGYRLYDVIMQLVTPRNFIVKLQLYTSGLVMLHA